MVLVATVLGCETIDDRIARNAEYFSALPESVQTHLRAGEVELGYTEAMAEIAFGRPDTVRRRANAQGETVAWLYRNNHPVYEGTYLVGYRVYEVESGGVRRLIHFPEFRPFYRNEAKEYLRLTFSRGTLVEIERSE